MPQTNLKHEQVFLAPRSNETSHDNLTSTIEHGIPFSQVGAYLAPAGKEILYKYSRLYAWGNQESPRGKGSWEKMQINDLVLFYVKGFFIYSGRVLYKQLSSDLSNALWPPSEKFGNRPWSCVFFLRDIREINVPLSEIADLAGYNMDRVMGFQSLNEQGYKRIIEKYGSLDDFLSVYQTSLKREEVTNINRSTYQDQLSPEDLAVIDEMTRTKDLEGLIQQYNRENADKTPDLIEIRTQRIKRNYLLVKALKEKYDNKCQIKGCEFTFKMTNGKFYSEAAHITPIAVRTPGVDVADNILILCPNHHKMLDFGGMKVTDKSAVEIKGQKIDIIRK